MPETLRPWKTVDRRDVFTAEPYLTVSVETVELPDGRRIDDYYQITTPDFICVFAETEDGRVVMVRQYKHGARRVSLTFPGGGLNPGEEPLAAARRELREETGYEAAQWRPLGSYVTNSNQRSSTAHLFHATGCRPVTAPDAGDLEEMEILLMTREALLAAAGRGEFPVLNQLALLAIVTHPTLAPALVAETV